MSFFHKEERLLGIATGKVCSLTLGGLTCPVFLLSVLGGVELPVLLRAGEVPRTLPSPRFSLSGLG